MSFTIPLIPAVSCRSKNLNTNNYHASVGQRLNAFHISNRTIVSAQTSSPTRNFHLFSSKVPRTKIIYPSVKLKYGPIHFTYTHAQTAIACIPCNYVCSCSVNSCSVFLKVLFLIVDVSLLIYAVFNTDY